MGFIPKFFWGRRNPNYTGPSRAAGIASTVTGDAMRIAQDFAHVVDAAEKAEYEGDEKAAEALRVQAAKIFSTHRYHSNMVNSIPDRQDELDRWEEAYQNMRSMSGLDRRHSGPASPPPEAYSAARISPEDIQEVKAAMRAHPDSGTPEGRRAYAEATGRPAPAGDTFSDGTPIPEPPPEVHDHQPELNAGDDTFSDGTPLPEEPPSEDAAPPPPEADRSGAHPDDHEEIPMPEEPIEPEGDLPPDIADIENSEDEKTLADLVDRMGGGSKRKSQGGAKKKRTSAGPGRPSKQSGVLTSVEQATGLDRYGSTRITWRPRLGPLIMNMGRNGPSSLSLAVGPIRYRLWSRTHKQGLSSLDLPGGMSFRGRQISRDDK